MNKFIVVFFTLTRFCIGVISAQSTTDKFTKATHTFQGTSLPYRIFIPEGNDPNKKYPLVLALHGMGERGNDNNIQLTANKMATSWAETNVQSKNPCFVIAPQCPVTSGWADSPVQDVLYNLVETVVSKYNIDADRVYVTGLSMGGNGTWNSICQRPDLFAAAVPIAGWGNNAKAPLIKNIPIWAFHGQADNTISVDNSRFMVDAIIKQGIEAVYTNCYYVDKRPMSTEKLNNELAARSSLIYTELYGYPHNVWDYAYNYKPMLDWVFSKRRFIKNAINFSTGVRDTTVYEPFSIKWNSEFTSDSVEIWFKSERQEYWKLLKKEVAGKGEFTWNTDAENECIYGKLRICLTDSVSRVFSQVESASITIDQAGNCPPFVKLKTPDFYKASNIISKRIDVNYIANDAESDSVTVVFNYSADGGKLYYSIDTVKVLADNEMKTQTIRFSRLLNTNNGILKLIVFDEQSCFSADSTIPFTNQLGVDVTAVSTFSSNYDVKALQCYPNPANQVSNIILDLPVECDVNIFVYNNLGMLVFQKEEKRMSRNRNVIQIPTSLWLNGIYSYSVSFGDENNSNTFRKSGKLIVRH